jgi:hypothetical protein
LANHDIPKYEGEFIPYFRDHPEAIDEYCLFLSNLYESAKQSRDYEIQRLVYRYLKNHKIILEELLERVPDRISLYARSPEEFFQPKFDDQMSKNLIGDICSVFTKAFKLAVVKRDEEVMKIMVEMIRLYDQVLEDLIRGIIPEVLGVDDSIRTELRMKESVLNSKLRNKKEDRTTDLSP